MNEIHKLSMELASTKRELYNERELADRLAVLVDLTDVGHDNQCSLLWSGIHCSCDYEETAEAMQAYRKARGE